MRTETKNIDIRNLGIIDAPFLFGDGGRDLVSKWNRSTAGPVKGNDEVNNMKLRLPDPAQASRFRFCDTPPCGMIQPKCTSGSTEKRGGRPTL